MSDNREEVYGELDELKHDDGVTVVIKVFLVVGVIFGLVLYGAFGGVHG